MSFRPTRSRSLTWRCFGRAPIIIGKAHSRPKDIFFLIEVSDTTGEYDRMITLPLYAQAGIQEVWIVDLAAGCVDIYLQPGPSGHQRVQRFTRGQFLAPQAFPDIRLPVDDILG